MSDFLAITLTGVDGSVWHLCGPDEGAEGVILAPKPQMFIDAPVKTFWIDTSTGSHYLGFKPQRRDPLFTVIVFGDDPREWRDIESRFRMAVGMYDKEFTITFDTGDEDPRSLKCRLLEQPKAYESQQWEGKDPHLISTSSLMITAAAAQPFWEASPVVSSWTLPSGTSGSGVIAQENLGDVDVWPRYAVTAPGSWVLPDYSWGNDYWGHALRDATRTVALPTLVVGESLDVQTDPRSVDPWVAQNAAPVWLRNKGVQHIYPIAPQTPSTNVPVSVTGASAGATVTCVIPRRFSRPMGVSL